MASIATATAVEGCVRLSVISSPGQVSWGALQSTVHFGPGLHLIFLKESLSICSSAVHVSVCPSVCPSIHSCVHVSVLQSIHPSTHPPSHPCSQYRLGAYYGPGTISSTGWEHSGGAFCWGPAMVSNIVATPWPWSCWALAVAAERRRPRALICQSLLWACAGKGDSRT